tara:strand:- start:1475 stop:2176 length:702 start_codon:yes stop_codon:yes gene_type:complete
MKEPVEYELDVLADLNNYNRWIAESFHPFSSGSLIEFGAGIGTLSALFLPYSRKLTLVEPSPELFKKLETKFAADSQITLIQNSLELAFEKTAEKDFDTALLSNVLEHIEDDQAALQMVSKRLRPGGHLLVFVPALQALYSDLDRAVGHHRRYHLQDLKQKAQAAGFEIIKLQYFDWIGALLWWLANIILKRTNINPNSAKLYDQVGIPITRQIERLFPPPFGKNIILVARKI